MFHPNPTTTTNFAEKHYGDLFFVMFQPSPPLTQAMQEKIVISPFMIENDTTKEQHHDSPTSRMLPPNYAVAHYRSLYGSLHTPPSLTYMTSVAKNAVNCASKLFPGEAIVFLSDSIEAASALMIELRREQHGGGVPPAPSHKKVDGVFFKRNMIINVDSNNTRLTSTKLQQPLHLDKATRQQQERSLRQQQQQRTATGGTTNFEPSDFYDTFIDLFLMANARCVSYGQGGFGKMGSMLSSNPTCNNRHFENGKMVRC